MHAMLRLRLLQLSKFLGYLISAEGVVVYYRCGCCRTRQCGRGRNIQAVKKSHKKSHSCVTSFSDGSGLGEKSRAQVEKISGVYFIQRESVAGLQDTDEYCQTQRNVSHHRAMNLLYTTYVYCNANCETRMIVNCIIRV